MMYMRNLSNEIYILSGNITGLETGELYMYQWSEMENKISMFSLLIFLGLRIVVNCAIGVPPLWVSAPSF